MTFRSNCLVLLLSLTVWLDSFRAMLWLQEGDRIRGPGWWLHPQLKVGDLSVRIHYCIESIEYYYYRRENNAQFILQCKHRRYWICYNELPKNIFEPLPQQCGTNIRIFEYIRIYLDEYIHSSKYSFIFSEANIFGYSFVI